MFYIDNELDTIDKYDIAKFVEMDENGVLDSLNSYFLYQIPLLPMAGEYTIRTEDNRPDMLSYHIYGETQYWWILLWYNGLMKPQDLKTGIVIKYPSIRSIEELYRDNSLLNKGRK